MEEITNTEENKSLYEISFIQEGENEGVPKKVIEKHGGQIVEDKPLVRIRFAYPIKKQTQGFFGVMRFCIDPLKVGLIDADLKFEKEVLRAIIVQFSEKDKNEEAALEGQENRLRRGKFVRTERKPGYEPALSNEALEKKIEEILQ
jgi:ribosomal protein S6